MIKKSQHDIEKETIEESALNQAISLSKYKRKLTRQILSYMNGKTINREKNDKPDIVRIIPEQFFSGEKLIIGIEHFLVEQISVGKKSKRISILQEKRSYIKKLIAEEKKENNSAEYQKLREIVTSIIFEIAEKANSSRIPELKESFCVALNNHLARENDYYDNMKKLAKGNSHKLALLIEIHCKTDDDFLNNGRTVIRKHNDIYPVFDWMVDELEKIDSEIIDYIILYFKHSIHEGIEDVIGIETKDIRGGLKKQGIIVYHYCDDPDKTKYNNLGLSGKGLKYSIEMENKETYIDDMEPILQKAYEYKKNSIPFVAPRAIQEFLYALGDRYNGKNLKEIIYTPETLFRFDQFIRKYPLEKPKDEIMT